MLEVLPALPAALGIRQSLLSHACTLTDCGPLSWDSYTISHRQLAAMSDAELLADEDVLVVRVHVGRRAEGLPCISKGTL